MIGILSALAARAVAQSYIWSGELPTGWQGQVTPPNNGTANLFFDDSLFPQITLTSSLDNVNSIVLENGNDITFVSAAPLTLSLAAGIGSADEQSGSIDFASNINLAISGSEIFNAGENFIYVRGLVTGSGNLTLVGGPAGNASIVFSNPAGNTYTGNTFIGNGVNTLSIGIWNSAPFGTGTVTFLNGGNLTVHGTQVIANPLVINSSGSGNFLGLKSWDAPVIYSGPVTLDNNVIFNPKATSAFLPTPTSDGSVPIPGALTRNPIILSGDIGESGGPRNVGVGGQGILMLTGTSNTYTGGTSLNPSFPYGSLVFGANSIPATGLISVPQGSYVGTADPSPTAFSNLLGHVSLTSSGSFGIDTLPGNATTIFSGSIYLAGMTNPSVEIGTATSAILTGSITPQSSAAFRFGGGGGVLYVDTPLASGVGTNVVVDNFGSPTPLTVYLQAVNTYLGSTNVNNGFLIFDGAGAMPGTTSLKANGNSSNVGASYLGYTDNAIGTTPASFLGYFNKASTWGIVGFDSSNPASPVTIGNVDLTGFNDGTFIGTTTVAVLTGALTPSTVTNGNQSANTLRLTAAGSGKLIVDSVITDNGSPVPVVIGSPSFQGVYSSGTVVMNGSNSYSGGTVVNTSNSAGITLSVGSNSALGTGPVTLASTPGGGAGFAGIQASTPGVNLPNSISFQDIAMSGAPQLNLTGTNTFTLSGAITGDNTSIIELFNAAPLTVALSGNNSAFSGDFQVYNGTLELPTSNSAGSGTAEFDFQGAAGTIDLTGATAPVVERLHGNSGNLVLGAGTVLTVDATNATGESDFGGNITGTGSLVVTNFSTMNNRVMILYGNNSYSGGTTVTQNGLLVIATNQGAGTGPVTVATSSTGAFGLDTGVTFTNPLVFTTGNLVGYGTFNPSGAGLSGTVTIGPGQGVAPGIPTGHNKNPTGSLSFAGNMAFDNGGSFYWTIQDNARVDGVSQLNIAGNLTINATAGGFGINLLSYDTSGNSNPAANFNVYAPYSWVIATTGGTIQNFNPTDFTLGVAGFENGIVPLANLSLTVNGADNQLILNFTPVPEPSTYVLVAAGIGIMAAAALRKRRA